MDMLNDFIDENYTNEKSVQLCRWRKRLNKKPNDLKGADRTLMKLFNYCNDLYLENIELKKNKNIELKQNENIEKVSEVKPKVSKVKFNNYIGIRNNNERIETNNIIVGKKFKTIKPKKEKEKEEEEYFMEGKIKVITSMKNHNVPDIIRVMKGVNNTINLEMKTKKLEGKTKYNIENWINKNALKMIEETYNEICKPCNIKLNEELYKKIVIRMIKITKRDIIKFLKNY